MNSQTLRTITPEEWSIIITATTFKIRCVLFNKDSKVDLYIKYI
jgi:hypothetical protein